MADDSPFARDFGYLMPFLDKVEKASSTLAEPAARAEAMRLAGEEKARWSRLRALLEGAPGSATAAGPPAAPPGRAEPVRSAPAPEADVTAPRQTWTVGTLRGRS